jgi:hypothetical protein
MNGRSHAIFPEFLVHSQKILRKFPVEASFRAISRAGRGSRFSNKFLTLERLVSRYMESTAPNLVSPILASDSHSTRNESSCHAVHGFEREEEHAGHSAQAGGCQCPLIGRKSEVAHRLAI